MRSIVVRAAVAALLLATPGLASGAPAVCLQVADHANDANLIYKDLPVMAAPAHDIRGIAVATGKKTLVVELQLTSTKYPDDKAATMGMTYTVRFRIGDVDHAFTRKIDSAGKVTDGATANNAAIGGLQTKVTEKAIRWTVPRANVPKLKKAGAVLTSFFTSASSLLANDWAPDSGQVSSNQYRDRTPSCLKPA